MKVFTSSRRHEYITYRAVVEYLRKSMEPNKLEILEGLDDPIITDIYGLRVFTGFELIPIDFIPKIRECPISDIQQYLNLSYMTAHKLKNTVMSGYPVSFCILLKLYNLLCPDHEIFDNPYILRLLQKIKGK